MGKRNLNPRAASFIPFSSSPLRPKTPERPRTNLMDYQRDNSLCYRCSQSGHISRHCPTKPRAGERVFRTTTQRILDQYNQVTNGDLSQPIDPNDRLKVPFFGKRERTLLAEALKQQIFATACGLPEDYRDIPGPYIKGIFKIRPEDIEDFANDDDPEFVISNQDGESENDESSDSDDEDPSLNTKANSTDDEQSQTDNDDEDDSSSNESDSDNDSQMSNE
jgi:hypothetical protein